MPQFLPVFINTIVREPSLTVSSLKYIKQFSTQNAQIQILLKLLHWRVRLLKYLKFWTSFHLGEIWCFSEGIKMFTHKKTKTVLTIQLSLKNPATAAVVRKEWEQFIMGNVKRFVQCHVFTQSLPGRRFSDKYPVNNLHWSQFV